MFSGDPEGDDDDFFNSFDRLNRSALLFPHSTVPAAPSQPVSNAESVVSSSPVPNTAVVPTAVTQRPNKRRRTGGERVPARSKSWTCAACTLINTRGTRCAACAAPREETSASLTDARSSEEIVEEGDCAARQAVQIMQFGIPCPQCTFLNPPQSITCEMCDWAVVNVAPVGIPSPAVAPTAISEAPTPADDLHPYPAPSSPLAVPPTNEVSDVDEELEEEESSSSSDSSVNSSRSTSPRSREDDMEPCDIDLVQFLQNLDSASIESLPLSPPPHSMAAANLRGFQLQALHWMMMREQQTVVGDDDFALQEADPLPSENSLAKVRGGLFADYMGLGKTRTLISLCQLARERIRMGNFVSGSELVSTATLIVAPTSLVTQWIHEIRSCVTPTPRTLHYYGSNRRKLSMFQLAEKYDYVLVSYQTLRSEAFSGGNATMNRAKPVSNLFMIKWHRVILDEAHYIKNVRSKQSRSCFMLSAVNRWAVTATPIQNSINDVFALLKFLHVPFFSNVKWWNDEIIFYLRQDIKHRRPNTALKLLFASISLRRTPATIIDGKPLLELPPLKVDTLHLPLSRDAREFYDYVYQQASEKIRNIAERHVSHRQNRLFQTAFEMLIRCRQACLHPYIVMAALQRTTSSILNASTDTNHSSGPTDNTAINHVINTFIEKELLQFIKKAQLYPRRGGKGSAENSMPEFVRELTDALRERKLQERECLICLESLSSPTILPCAHAFCRNCIQHALQISHRCPLCKQRVPLNSVLTVPDAILGTHDEPGESNASPPGLPAVSRSIPPEELKDVSKWGVAYSDKTRILVDKLRLVPPGDKVIVFSSFVTYLTFLKDYLDRETEWKNILFTGTLTLHQKNCVIDSFRSTAPEAPRILLATITACGVGFNLECANHGFIMEPSYNPAVEAQALHRLHRMGQEKPVFITKMIASDTIEERMEALSKEKSAVSDYCFNGVHTQPSGAPRGRTRVTTAELLALFAPPQESSDSSSESESE